MAEKVLAKLKCNKTVRNKTKNTKISCFAVHFLEAESNPKFFQ